MSKHTGCWNGILAMRVSVCMCACLCECELMQSHVWVCVCVCVEQVESEWLRCFLNDKLTQCFQHIFYSRSFSFAHSLSSLMVSVSPSFSPFLSIYSFNSSAWKYFAFYLFTIHTLQCFSHRFTLAWCMCVWVCSVFRVGWVQIQAIFRVCVCERVFIYSIASDINCLIVCFEYFIFRKRQKCRANRREREKRVRIKHLLLL